MQGYVEGEFVYVASPLAGQVVTLSVECGDAREGRVEPLFALDSTLETAARDEADRHLAEAKANFEDATKGKRPSEIQSIQAQLAQARAALEFAEKRIHAGRGAHKKQAACPGSSMDQGPVQPDQARHRVTQLQADLEDRRTRPADRPDCRRAARGRGPAGGAGAGRSGTSGAPGVAPAGPGVRYDLSPRRLGGKPAAP